MTSKTPVLEIEAAIHNALKLQTDARWLDALDTLPADCDEAAERMGYLREIKEIQKVGSAFREARRQCSKDEEIEWEVGHSYLGTSTSFRHDENGTLWLKTEGVLEGINLFHTVSVIREVKLYTEWVPLTRFVEILKEVDFSRMCTHFAVGVPGILVRDCVLRASACNAAISESSLYFIGSSPQDDDSDYYGTSLPQRKRGFAFDRMKILALNAKIEFIQPDAQHCKIIVAIDLRIRLPQSILDFMLKRLVGIFLILWRRQSRRLDRDPQCPHRKAMDSDPDFYQWLKPMYHAFLKERGWHDPHATSTHQEDDLSIATAAGGAPDADIAALASSVEDDMKNKNHHTST
mmetsp:Transcript_15137/g.22727  ORF Transcript_15137/g.22727 Transcript_15137/m.22727 type:complete len:348 (-) Transcript_15137:293-1336(-)